MAFSIPNFIEVPQEKPSQISSKSLFILSVFIIITVLLGRFFTLASKHFIETSVFVGFTKSLFKGGLKNFR